MEVACGEYGDMVPSLVVAVKGNVCEQYQHLMKVANYEKVKDKDYESNLLPASKSSLMSADYAEENHDTGFVDYLEKSAAGGETSVKESSATDDIHEEKIGAWIEDSHATSESLLQVKPLTLTIDIKGTKDESDDVSSEIVCFAVFAVRYS
jgi:hypothetical protein